MRPTRSKILVKFACYHLLSSAKVVIWYSLQAKATAMGITFCVERRKNEGLNLILIVDNSYRSAEMRQMMGHVPLKYRVKPLS